MFIRDEFSFMAKSRKAAILLCAFLLTLIVTVGSFAYAYTTNTTTINVTGATNDFATVTGNNTVPSYLIFGSYRGAIQAGYLFKVTPTNNYPGDLEVTVYLSNLEELSENYRYFMMRLQLVNASNNPVDAEGITRVLSTNNGVTGFYFPSANFTPGRDYFVRNLGGAYISLPWGQTGWTIRNPVLTCQVTPAK